MSLVAKTPHPLPGVGRSSIGAYLGIGRSRYANMSMISEGSVLSIQRADLR